MARLDSGKVKRAKVVKHIENPCVFFEHVKSGFKLLEVIRDRRQKVVQVPAHVTKLSAGKLNTLKAVTPIQKKPRACNYSYRYPAGLLTTDPLTYKVNRGKLTLKDLPEKVTRPLLSGNYAKLVTVTKDDDTLAKYLVVGRTTSETEEDVEWESVKHPERFNLVLVEGDKKYLPEGYSLYHYPDFEGWVCDGYYFTGETLNIESELYYAKPDSISENEKEHIVKLSGKVVTIPKDQVDESSILRLVAYRSNNRIFNKVTTKVQVI